MIAVNTTAGTASEITRFCIITDTSRHVKMAIVDWRVTPQIAINDPNLMVGMPPALTAATGMDALTHAVEAYIDRFYNTRETRSLARQAVEAIYRMNRALGIPERFPCIRSEDLPQMAAWAEANPAYPVPVIFGKEDLIRVARRVMP